jgi:hypothetical protein
MSVKPSIKPNLLVRSVDVLIAWIWCVSLLMLELLGGSFPAPIPTLIGLVFLASLGYLLYSAVTVILYESFRSDLRVALTIGVFVSGSIVAGVLLNLTPLGLTARVGWMASYTFLAGLALIVVVSGRIVKPHPMPLEWALDAPKFALFTLAVSIVASAYLLAQAGISAQPAEGFTQFWMLRSDDPNTLDIGIFNVERMPKTYRVTLTSGDVIVAEWNDIVLNDNAEWRGSFELSPGMIYPITAELTVDGHSGVYRQTEFWLPDAATAPATPLTAPQASNP